LNLVETPVLLDSDQAREVVIALSIVDADEVLVDGITKEDSVDLVAGVVALRLIESYTARVSSCLMFPDTSEENDYLLKMTRVFCMKFLFVRSGSTKRRAHEPATATEESCPSLANCSVSNS